MKKTIVEYFCDKCDCKLKAQPNRGHEAGKVRDYSGEIKGQFRVIIEYEEYMGVQFQQSMLCDKCKIEALEEVLKTLKSRRKNEH